MNKKQAGYLFKKTANGLRKKIINEKQENLNQELNNIWEKYW